MAAIASGIRRALRIRRGDRFLLAMALIGSICFAMVIVLSTILLNLYDISLYEKSYERYEVYRRFETSVAKSRVLEIFSYMRGGIPLDSVFFNRNEISHLTDVKVIVDRMEIALIASTILLWVILVYSIFRKRAAKVVTTILLMSSIMVISMIALMAGIYLLAGFDSSFLGFHEMFFEGNYMFDPRTSNMINLFPSMYFLDVAMMITKKMALTSVLSLVAGLLLKRLYGLVLDRDEEDKKKEDRH